MKNWYKKYKEWWASAQSSLKVHRGMKWIWVALWILCEGTGQVTSVSLVSRLSFVALILTSWGAEEAAKTEVKQEEAEEAAVEEEVSSTAAPEVSFSEHKSSDKPAANSAEDQPSSPETQPRSYPSSDEELKPRW